PEDPGETSFCALNPPGSLHAHLGSHHRPRSRQHVRPVGPRLPCNLRRVQHCHFAQGGTMMMGAVLFFTLSVTAGWPTLSALPIALAACAFWSVLVERVAVRPFVRRGSNSWLMATVALGIALENGALFAFGRDPRGMPPSYLTTHFVSIGGLKVQWLQILIPIVGPGLAFGLHLLFQRPRHGKALLAVVQNTAAARLMGIDVERVTALAYALSGLLAGVAGFLVAPLFTVSSTMGTLFGIK